VPALDRDVGGTFTVFGRRWATFPASVDDRTLTITTPTGANAFDHLWGFYLPVEVCSTTVEFDAQVQAADGMGDYGIGIAPRSSLVGDQPTGYSVQYEWEGSDINADPGTYVRPSGLPARAWAIEVDPAPAPDLRQRRHVKVSALGTALTIGIDGRDVAQYELPQADCGGVTIRSWGARASFSNVCVTGL